MNYKIKPSKKLDFKKDWLYTTPKQKLLLYRFDKIRLLAKYKGISNYQSMTKKHLITLLSPIVVKSDFPIKLKEKTIKIDT